MPRFEFQLSSNLGAGSLATVLIVEDEDSLRDTLSRYLTHEGFDVISAASGHEALEARFGASPDILIAD